MSKQAKHMPNKKDSLAWYDSSIVSPPSNVTVTRDPKVVLYDASGTPLIKQIGFKKEN